MKRIISLLLVSSILFSCESQENQSDNEKNGAADSDSVNVVDKVQEDANELVDSMQSKGEKVIEKVGDTLKDKVLEPVKKEAKKVGEMLKEGVKDLKEKIKQ